MLMTQTIGYEYQLRRRNVLNTGWTNPHKWVNLATRLENRITTYNDFVRLRGGQAYQIRIRSYKLYNRSEPTAYQSVIPLSPMGEIFNVGWSCSNNWFKDNSIRNVG